MKEDRGLSPMKLLFFCPRWGQAHLSWEDFAAKVKAAGYDGVETDIPADQETAGIMLEALARQDLLLVAQHWETVDPDPEVHIGDYVKRLQRMASVRPLFINSQTGRDFFSRELNERLLSEAAAVEAKSGVAVYHETHRGKFSFAAHVTAGFLERNPGLRLTLDISHWMVVAETFLEDQPRAVTLAIDRTRHIHARVGYTQGAQVADPRAPQWQEPLQKHLGYWDRVVESNRRAGVSFLPITTEFGPPPYMPVLPYTGATVADQWEINAFMMETIKGRYLHE